MSKLSEQKALEVYPPENGTLYQRLGYVKGYDQAMQDLMEKAEMYLQNTLYDRVEREVYGTLIPDIIDKKGFIENFKNYMQDEEKAIKIADNCGSITYNGHIRTKFYSERDCVKAALEMAAWKEQQLIEKVVEYLEPVFKNLAGYNCGGDLIEDFKNYMQDESEKQ